MNSTAGSINFTAPSQFNEGITADKLTAGTLHVDTIITRGNQVASQNNTRGGPGLLGLLTLLFVGLKLTDNIDWSWWLVLLPLYGPLALALGVFVCVLLPIAILNKKQPLASF